MWYSCSKPCGYFRPLLISIFWATRKRFFWRHDGFYWSRQIIGVVLGLIWGLLPLQGFIGIFLFAALSAGVVYVWFTAVQGVDEAEYGGKSLLIGWYETIQISDWLIWNNTNLWLVDMKQYKSLIGWYETIQISDWLIWSNTNLWLVDMKQY